MGTIKDFSAALPGMIDNVLKNRLLEKLDPILKQRLFESGGDIIVDYNNKSFIVEAGSDELEKAIIADLKSKK